jgi:uncharacterized membrane protein
MEREKTMDDQTMYLSVGYFKDEESAETIRGTIESMHRAANIDLVDVAMVTKSEDGKLHVKESRELTAGKGARRGAIILGIFGLIYPPSFIASVIAGGGIGAIAGRIRDTGIKKAEMRKVTDKLEPGMAAVVVLANEASQKMIVDTLDELGGQVESHQLGGETAADVAALAGETSAPTAEAE